MVKLKIADTIISFISKFPSHEDKADPWFSRRYKIFFTKNPKPGDIQLNIKVVSNLPKIPDHGQIFITYHPDSQEENWRLVKTDKGYIYQSLVKGKEQVIFINQYFNQARVYLLPKPKYGLVWSVSDLVYDFLLVLLMNYFAQRKNGIFIHGVGIKDTSGSGFIFAGKSGAGKSTTARIWHKYSKTKVLNDDRIIVRKIKGKFFIFGSPWHGEFSDYLGSDIESARLDKFFFIRHSPKNIIRALAYQEAMSFIYPLIFLTFWDKELLNNLFLMALDLVQAASCFRLGFVANQKVVKFIREIK